MKHILCSLFVLLLAVNCIQAEDVPFIELKGHAAWVNFAVYTPDGKKIITASMDDTVRLWNAETGEELKKMEVRDGLLRASAFTPDRKRMVATGRVARMLAFELGEELQVIQIARIPDDAYISPDGSKIASTVWSPEDKLYGQLWDAETGRESHRLAVPGISVYQGAFSPDGKKIVMRLADNTAVIWDTESGNALHILRGHTNTISTIDFSPDGTKIITGNSGRIADKYYSHGVNFFRIWDVESGKELHKFTVLQGGSGSAEFSPDGKKLVTTSGSTAQGRGSFARITDTRIWDTESGKELQKLTGAEGFIVFSPDGKKIVTGGEGHTAVVWDAESGKELQRLQGNPDSRASVGNYFISLMSYDPKVSSITFSPDGKRVVTASNDGSVRVWDISAIMEDKQ